MAQPPAPLPPSRRARIVLRVIGFSLLGVGLALAISGGLAFAEEVNSYEDTGFGSIVRLGAGGFMIVFGLAALNAGFIGAQARYAAGETMPTLKQSAAYLSDGEGVSGVGRTVDDDATDVATGPFCRSCGVRNDAEARFCDACGRSLA